jgi:hypothetical protein
MKAADAKQVFVVAHVIWNSPALVAPVAVWLSGSPLGRAGLTPNELRQLTGFVSIYCEFTEGLARVFAA